MKIGLVSDVHADADALRDALELFFALGVDQIFCAGDIAGYGNQLAECVELLQRYGCLAVRGNHDQWHVEDWSAPPRVAEAYLRNLPLCIEQQVDGMLLHMLHASPLDPLNEGIRLRDPEGRVSKSLSRHWVRKLEDYPCDLLVVGHTHQVFAIELGDLLLVNPGSTTFNHSCAILSLPERKVEFFPLSNRPLLKCWHFGMLRRNSR